MSKQPQIGDLVALNSGGPVMTVQFVDTDSNEVQCQWFSGKKLESGCFPVDSLVEAPNPPEL